MKDTTQQNTSLSKSKFMTLRKQRIRNIIINTISIILILLGVIWVIHHFWRYTEYEITNDAVVDQYIAPVNIRVQGYIKTVNFTEHQKVKAGDTLIIIDNSEYSIKMIDAQAALEDAQANADMLSTNILTSKSNIEVADASIKEAEIKLWKLGEDEKRYKDLLNENSTSLREYEQVKTDYDAAKARITLLQKQKNSSLLQTQEVIKKTNSLKAIISRRESDLAMAKLNLSYTIVKAPYDGYIGRRTLEEGQLVQAGQILTYIIRDNKKWITANYKETQISNVFIGQEVNIKVDAYKGKVFKGVVTEISEATGSKYSLIPTDNSAGNFVKIQQRIPVRIEFTDREADLRNLRAGMMVETEAKLK